MDRITIVLKNNTKKTILVKSENVIEAYKENNINIDDVLGVELIEKNVGDNNGNANISS